MTSVISSSEAMDAAFAGQACHLVLADGTHRTMQPQRWSGPASPSDLALFVDPCDGPVLDLGCGPGRLVGALAARGVEALGVDISTEAVRQTRNRGGAALCRDVFDDLPDPRRWRHVLLADGNIGLGGRPVRLLRRVADMLAPSGTALVELSGSGSVSVHENVQLRVGDRTTTPFAWATVGTGAIDEVAAAAGLVVTKVRHVAQRHVATLRHRSESPTMW